MVLNIDTNEVLDDNIVKILRGILSGGGVTPLNGNEQYILKMAGVLKTIDDLLPDGLLSFVGRYKQYISASNCVHLLLNAYKYDRLEEVVNLMIDVEVEEFYLSKEACLKLLKSDMPMLWSLHLLSEDESFHKKHSYVDKPTIDINRLREFK